MVETPTERFTKCIQYFDSVGFRGLTTSETSQIIQLFAQELQGGLQNPPNPGSLKMIDTHLFPLSSDNLRHYHVGEEALILEIGGTNVFAAWVTIGSDGVPRILRDPSSNKELSMRGELRKRVFNSPQEFFHEALHHVNDIVARKQITALGIIYSFPASVVDVPLGVDVMSPASLPKGFYIDGIDAKPVGSALIEHMRASGVYHMDTLDSLVVLNDTPAALLSTPSKIGGIVGTGYNLAMSVEGKIFNIECGGFHHVPQHPFVEKVDKKSANPGLQRAEKQIAGMYLGAQLEAVIETLVDLNVIHVRKTPEFGEENLPAEVVSHIIDRNIEKLTEYIYGDFTEEALSILYDAAMRLRNRSAQIVGAKLATIVRTFPDEFPDEQIIVPIEGSVFWKMSGYKDCVCSQANILTGKDFQFPYIDHAGSVGAAAAVVGRRTIRLK
ncbi:hypothetical protein KKB64_02105 [Patescibacteria group bacterium]|nr:hypothetical protein [Patescibacteria group bacterium]MBU1472564.1 hypothetical protein [Patescibacteria group bacterium]MBU2459815.1 hypothetical protein [Patescibacteria group bacterium]MBU2544123.1 hypothetical protein [Patescibacteria group bacterium]